MRDEDSETLFYLSAGPMAAILLGAALIPLRGVTSASNLAFAFIALTIAVAELGGKWAALLTAVSSALSLNFFLTRPYLRLTIYHQEDVIAFVGLAGCGLVAAAFRAQRSRSLAALGTLRKQLDLLHATVIDTNGDGPTALEPRLAKLLHEFREVLPIAAATLRDRRGYLLASAGPEDTGRALPDTILEPDVLLPAADPPGRLPRTGLALPAEGGRIPVTFGSHRLGWLDVWGNGVPAGVETRRVLSDLARLLAVRLAVAEGPAGAQS